MKQKIPIAALDQIARQQEKIERLLAAGEQLSNIAFNWAQDTSRPESDRKMLNECRIKWDAAAAMPNGQKLRHSRLAAPQT